MKKIVLAILFIFIFVLTPSLSFAIAPSDGAQTSTSSAKPRSEKAADVQASKMEDLRGRGLAEIDRRVDALNKLISRIYGFKHLTPDQKTSLTSQVQAEIDNLTTLRAKIAADTDFESLKADVKGVVNSYRVYALFIPKIKILSAADVLLNAVEKFNMLYAELQAKVAAAKSAGGDVTALEEKLSSMQSKIESAQTKAQSAIDTAMPLTPDGYPGNKTSLQTARTSLHEGKKDLHSARDDAKAINQGLKPSGATPSGRFKVSTTSAVPLP